MICRSGGTRQICNGIDNLFYIMTEAFVTLKVMSDNS